MENNNTNNTAAVDLSAMNLGAIMAGAQGGNLLGGNNKNDNFVSFKVYTPDPMNPASEGIWLCNISCAKPTQQNQGTVEPVKMILEQLKQIGVVKTYKDASEESNRATPDTNNIAMAFANAFAQPAVVNPVVNPVVNQMDMNPETPEQVEQPVVNEVPVETNK